MNKRILALVVVVVLAVVGVGAWWFLGEDTPDRVSLDNAVKGVSTTTGGGVSKAPTGSVSGSWTLDTSSGSFDYKSATGTFVGFRVGENLANVGATEAVGRTGDVEGTLTIDDTSLTEASFTAQMGSITTDRSMRDDRVRGALDVGQFPTATFELTSPVDFGDAAATGEAFSGTADGKITIHGVTEDVTTKLEAKLTGDTIVVVGSFEVTFADFGVSVPSSPVVVSADDHGTVEFQLLFTRS